MRRKKMRLKRREVSLSSRSATGRKNAFSFQKIEERGYDDPLNHRIYEKAHPRNPLSPPRAHMKLKKSIAKIAPCHSTRFKILDTVSTKFQLQRNRNYIN